MSVLLVAVSWELATDPSFLPFPFEEEVLMGGVAAALEADCAAEALDLVVTPIVSDGCVLQLRRIGASPISGAVRSTKGVEVVVRG